METFKSYGRLRYSVGYPYKLIVEADPELAAYYRWFLPKALNVSRGKYEAHITVVRIGKDTPTNLSEWRKYEGKTVEFLYEPYIYSGKIYYWLNILSKQLEEIRLELGLALEVFQVPPPGFIKYFHLTLGNTKRK